MGDLSPIKILILVVVALVVLGPEKLPEMTQKAGKAWADFRRFRESMEGQVRDAVGEAGLGDISQLTRFTNVGIKSTVASGVRSVLSSSTGVATSGIDGVESGGGGTEGVGAGDAAQPGGGAWTPPGPAHQAAAHRPAVHQAGHDQVGPVEPLFSVDDPGLN